MTEPEQRRLASDIKTMEKHWRDTFRSVDKANKKYQIEKLRNRVALYTKLVTEFESAV